MFNLIRKIIGTANDRIIKKLKKELQIINSLEEKYKNLSDIELRNQTNFFREMLSQGKTLKDIEYEAFACVREASMRVLGMRHFDVQIIGALILHRGMITEMRTGEGKTLVATLAAYLNALEGKGVHIVTVNDYLAKRDSEWMGKIFKFLGLTVGCITSTISDEDRKNAYLSDITYATNNELGFDFLRDNMKYSIDEKVQKPLNYAIIDEVDSILIDEARTPLIISGPVDDNSDLYYIINDIAKHLKDDDYEKDEKSKTVNLTEKGISKVEDFLISKKLMESATSIYDLENMKFVHYVNQSLKAHTLFTNNIDYIVKNGKLVIIDEFTGRMMEGRRYSDGLHQALEAKEGLKVQNENQTLASITFQNYFRMYKKLSGMTGTAMTEAAELKDIYNLDVVSVPTHHPVKRIDHDDEVYGTKLEKYDAIFKLIEEIHSKGQPVLVGTVSIEKSEEISDFLKKNNISHNVLNAKNHEQEAFIIAQAGRYKAVTIATNMAGRGTDIMLGGNLEMMLEYSMKNKNLNDEEIQSLSKNLVLQIQDEKQKVIEAGGLFVIGTERHESRRIDNQLRGRSGRQGDPGQTKFFLSLDDDLMRIFASDKIASILRTIGLKDGQAIQHPMISRTLEKSQQKVENNNYEIRKNLLKFDDVMNDQRKVVYELRNDIINSKSLFETLDEQIENLISLVIKKHIPAESFKENWDIKGLEFEINSIFNLEFDLEDFVKNDVTEIEVKEEISNIAKTIIKNKNLLYGEDIVSRILKTIFLSSIDQVWKDHLYSLDHLRQGISLRAYGQKDPLNEYKREAFNLFNLMLDNFTENVVKNSINFQIDPEHIDPEKLENFRLYRQRMIESREDPALSEYSSTKSVSTKPKTFINHISPDDRDPNDPLSWGKVSRNELCPCGSGKKYKHCHGAS